MLALDPVRFRKDLAPAFLNRRVEARRMTAVAPEVWAHLEKDAAKGDALVARRAAPHISGKLFAALDAKGERHFLIPVLDTEPEFKDTQSRGVTVSTRHLTLADSTHGRYLDVVCRDANGLAAFDLLGGDLADRLTAGSDSARDVVARVLGKWRRFWGQQPNQMLSAEEQTGLFAELWFLAVWLVPAVGAKDATIRWRGPHGARHDFEWPGKSVEVKATTSGRGRIHHINGLDQLAPPEEGKLLLFSLSLRDEQGATNTLPSIIAMCRLALEAHPDALSAFENALSVAGYSSVHEDEYARRRLRVVDEHLYGVEADFPRLTRASFPSGVPAGVERIDYEINLGGCPHLIVAKHPGPSAGL